MCVCGPTQSSSFDFSGEMQAGGQKEWKNERENAKNLLVGGHEKATRRAESGEVCGEEMLRLFLLWRKKDKIKHLGVVGGCLLGTTPLTWR